MQRWEILHTPVGEILGLVDCQAIANGASQKQCRKWSYDDAMKLR